MHMGNVECLVLCLQLWLATSYSEIITDRMDNVVCCEGGTGEFPRNNDTEPLLQVAYYFQNKFIAKSSSNFKSGVYKDENLKWRPLKDDNVAIRIEKVTEKDRGEYKIILTYTNGNELKLVGSLDVTAPGCGKLNITRDPNKPNVFRCGEKTGSDLYSWVLINATDVHRRNTKESELTLVDLNQNWSFYCIRLSDCQRSPWFNFTWDSSDQTEPVICCPGDTASFPWTGEIPPFYLIEWYFENTQLAEAYESPFPQESLHINQSYKGRFHLHKPGYAGFNLANVVKTDEGNYRLIITLHNSDIQLNWKLKVEAGVTGRRRERATSGVDEPFSCDADEQPPASDSSTDATIGIVVTVCIVVIVIAVVVVIVIKRKRNNHTQQGSADPDGNGSEETGPESHKLVVHEDQTRQPEGASPDSHEPIKQVDKTHQPDKQTCERMNLTQTC